MQNNASLRVVVDTWDALKSDASRIRHVVFVEEQRVSQTAESDPNDSLYVHALAFLDEKPVATGRLLPNGTIGRMAVLKECRGKGVGAAVLTALCEAAKKRGDKRVELHAQTRAREFYEKCGFVAFGELFMEQNIEHVMMEKIL